MLKKLLSCVGEYKKYAILTPIVMLGEVIMEVLIPLVMAFMVDNGIGKGDISYTIKMGLLMAVMAIFSLACGALGGKFAAQAGMGFAKNVRKKLFDKVQDFSFANVDKFSTASLVTRLTTDVTNVQNTFMMIIRMAVRSPFMLIFALIMAVSINAKLAMIFLIAIPVLGIGMVVITSTAFPRFEKMLAKYDALNSRVQENLIGIRVVKAFVREKFEGEKFVASADDVRAAQVKAEKVVILGQPLMQIAMYSCIVAVIYFGGNMVIGETMLIGQLSSFITYITQILMSLMMLSMIFVMTTISMASMHRIVEIFDEVPDIADNNADPALLPEDGSIVFDNVSFSYAKDKAKLNLRNIDLNIKTGETIGIIGGTGSAKSTLVQLIPRLYDVFDGRILVGGHDVRDYKIDNLRNEVAMVLQKNVLFSGTIKDNLRWGNENATDEEIIEACRQAQAHDFVMSFPDGYDTDLGQGGVNVSGGQKQRLCIARALLKKPKIVILDDSTSAVDTATDAKIRHAFKTELADTTTIIIAQRISSVAEADRIIVLDDGNIDAFDTHENLLKTNEIYREVYNSQQKGAEE
ncbi:MAG: ABC transporter ATP-binding protein [Oscillospiraceae bacterium]|nr:ABC transporter ATP-binding protein [Oscillospiraceae bacterium]MDY6207474.1 ABC transporter ATP-binding protein [Oscillospiraceae bacterium]